jgi:SAM-dependent methyltransferase
MNKKKYIQYGCGFSAPNEWINFDASPTLRTQKLPIIGKLFKRIMSVKFPRNTHYGDILKGLPVPDNSCDGIYCSHVLEHLSLSDFQLALKNTHKLLKKGGIFRLVVPDLEIEARNYVDGLNRKDSTASISFMENTSLGKKSRQKNLKAFLASFYGNSNHLWMWDYNSLSYQLKINSFKDIRRCEFNDCPDISFKLVESKSRFINAVAIECKK